MIEVCAVVALIGILVALLLPAVQAAREHARRTSCSNNLMQVAIGIRSYQAAHGHYPVQLHGTDGSVIVNEDNDRRLSYLVGVLPYINQVNLADMIRGEVKRVDPPVGGGLGFMDSSEMLDADGDELQSEDEAVEVRFWPRNGPEPFADGYPAWRTEVPTYRCPSDPGSGSYSSSGRSTGRSNYAACLGDGCVAQETGPYKSVEGVFIFDEDLAKQTNAAMRGAFVPRVPTRDSDITDGISYTLLLGEVCTSLGDQSVRTRPAIAKDKEQLLADPGLARTVDYRRGETGEAPLITRGYSSAWDTLEDPQLMINAGWKGSHERGLNWADGMPLYTGFNTVLPPNREIVLSAARDDSWGVLPPSSYHPGGVNVAMVDGSVRYISDDIDAGDGHQPTVHLGSANPPGTRSPFGVWGAMGTRASKELEGVEPLSQ